MTTRQKPGRRLLSLAAALAVGLLGLTSPARADSANIDANRRASLTLHKCTQPDTPGTAANGKVQEGTGCTPIAGVTFTLYKVDGIDLTTPDGWEKAQNLTAPESGTTVSGYSSTAISAVTTTGGGIANWPSLDLGLYLVVESDTGYPDTAVVIGSKPFLVTLPYYTTDDTAWNYDVHVYPKNSVAGLEKTVDDSIAQASYDGRNVKWTVTADIPPSGEGTMITDYAITDILPAGLILKENEIRITLDDGSVFTRGDEYTCAGTTTVTCTFTGSGITRLRGLGGREVSMTLLTDVTDVAQASAGVFTNRATVTINGAESPDETAETTWGQFSVYKYDGDTDGPLSGVGFRLCLEADCQNVAVQSMTTGSDGRLLFPAVRPGTYYLVEDDAPAGYVKAEPQQVNVAAGIAQVPAVLSSAGQNHTAVANTKQTVPQLPLTGGVGQVALAAGGIGLLVIGGAVMIISRAAARRRQA